jgi:hypothetical protein
VGDFAVSGAGLLAAAAVVFLAWKFVVARTATPVAATYSVGFHLGAPSCVVDGAFDCFFDNDMNALKGHVSQANRFKLMEFRDL